MEIKVLCSCGGKFAFEIEPQDGRMPFAIACPSCNADATEMANAVIQQKLALQPTPAPKPQIRLRIGAAAPPPVQSEANPAKPAMRLNRAAANVESAETAPAGPGGATGSEIESKPCPKHPRQRATDFCVVCQRPICPQCMEIFGYLCSPACRNRAELEKIVVPKCPTQKSVAKAKQWRKVLAATVAALALVGALFGAYIWYLAAGSRPRPYYSLKTPDSQPLVEARLLSPDRLLLLDRERLSVRDLKEDREIWTARLNLEKPKAAPQRAPKKIKLGDKEVDMPDFFEPFEPEPQFNMAAGDIWIGLPTQVLRFDPLTGNRKQAISIPGNMIIFAPAEDALNVVSASKGGRRTITHIDLPGGATRSEDLTIAKSQTEDVADEMSAGIEPTARLLLERELSSDNGDHKVRLDKLRTELVPAGPNLATVTVKLVQANVVTVNAMKPDSGKSLLGANTGGMTSTAAFAEETFNEIKRNSGAGLRTVDESRYNVTLRRVMSRDAREWSKEVTGVPSFFAEKTVDVLVAGKSLFLFNKQNKMLLETKLEFPISDGYGSRYRSRGNAPCIEREGVLYFYDQGVLTAFEVPSANIKWRLTSVGISHIEFDDDGKLYVSTTAAGPESIQYSEEISLDKTPPVILKVDPKNGRILWKTVRNGQQCHLSGKFVYATALETGGLPIAMAAANALGPRGGGSSHFTLYRLDRGNGKPDWEYYPPGSPSDLDFNQSRILLRYRDGVDVLKFLSF